jgi:hypothetical protein
MMFAVIERQRLLCLPPGLKEHHQVEVEAYSPGHPLCTSSMCLFAFMQVGRVFHPYQDRIVSVRECARAQVGFWCVCGGGGYGRKRVGEKGEGGGGQMDGDWESMVAGGH